MTSSFSDRDVLSAHRLRWRRANRWIVDEVSLVLGKGEIVGLLGPNGAGKTVTLSMIAGLLAPTSGTIRIAGRDVTDMPLDERSRCGLGYLPQERSVFRKLTAADNIAAMLEAHGVRGSALRDRTTELLERFGLLHVAHTLAMRLSGGEQRRLEIARSLATDPQFLLFDEPFAGIDPLTIESLHTILDGLRASGVGILLTDHNVREALSLCNRAYVMFRGRVLAEGTPPELIASDLVRERFLGEAFELVDDGV
jgi:lipopolysaccharide export system ATP-binding protein